MISFIHIGKTGGTTINKLLDGKVKRYRQYHLEKNYNAKEQYIIWLRNPITRFVSAFNHSYYGVHTDPKSISKFNMQQCLFPQRMISTQNSLYRFSKKYDTLIKQFNNANELAESLSSPDLERRKKARELMNSQEEHLFKGIGWYLNNGNFIAKNNDRVIFVGKLETMKDDIEALGKQLNVKVDSELKLRENIYVDESMKQLSPLAIQNIIEWYTPTDYAALTQLHAHGWISQEILDSYYKYSNE
jgi:hypothetical protein